ncbi:MAG: ATP-binding protein [Propionibacteriaceae bacterium]|nr:ATP-binding protein [Propionibacteriaceae bacterium]
MIEHPNPYQARVVDETLLTLMRAAGAVEIVGPKWCGKTTTAEQLANSAVYFQDPDTRQANLQLAASRPSLLLQGEKPVLLDEWQDAPSIWDAVRFAVDRDSRPGQFLLTGSATPSKAAEGQVRHSGTGRFLKLRMRPMSLYESGESNGQVSLSELFHSVEPAAQSLLSLEGLAQAIVRGGWPATVLHTGGDPLATSRGYLESLAESDISKVDGMEKNPRRVRLLLRSLARNESTQAAMTTLRADMAADEGSVSVNTIALYLNALRRLFVLDEQEAWPEGARSKVAQRSSPVRRFCDPSLATAALGITADKLLTDYSTLGLLFESLCIRDLRVYAEASGASVFHYRDARDLECDAIVENLDGSWSAFEAKLTASGFDDAAANLLNIKKHVRSQHGGEASFLAILTAEPYGYLRTDGVLVLPLACLKP